MPLRRRVPVVLGVLRRLASFSTAMSGDGRSGLPKPEVDDVVAVAPPFDLEVVDDREHVRGQVGDSTLR